MYSLIEFAFGKEPELIIMEIRNREYLMDLLIQMGKGTSGTNHLLNGKTGLSEAA